MLPLFQPSPQVSLCVNQSPRKYRFDNATTATSTATAAAAAAITTKITLSIFFNLGNVVLVNKGFHEGKCLQTESRKTRLITYFVERRPPIFVTSECVNFKTQRLAAQGLLSKNSY